jgi:site-specific DNA recombinase
MQNHSTPKPSSPRVWTYLRVSTKEQDDHGTSLPYQERDCLSYAARQSWGNIRVTKEDYSGLTLDRPVMNALREAVRAEQVDVVLVHRVDRLSRDEADPAILWKDFKAHGVELHTYEDGRIETREQFLLLMVKAVFSANYVATLKANAHRGRKGRVEIKGRIVGGYPLFGYDYVKGDKNAATGGYRVINPKTASIVQRVFEMYTRERMSLGAIATHLRAIGARTATGEAQWTRTSLRNMLRNSAYTGRTYALIGGAVEERVLLENVTPRLIDDATFARAQELLKENRTRGGARKREYLLSHLIQCGICGCKYAAGSVVYERTDGSEGAYTYYRCGHRNPSKAHTSRDITPCTGRNVAGSEIEPPVWDYLRSIILDPTIVDRELRARQEEARPVQAEHDLAIVRDELARNRADERKLIDYALKHGGDEMSDALIAERKEAIMRERATLTTKEADLMAHLTEASLTDAQRHSLVAQCAALAPVIDTMSVAEKNDVMRRLHVNITVSADRAEVTGFFPSFVVAYKESRPLAPASRRSGDRHEHDGGSPPDRAA